MNAELAKNAEKKRDFTLGDLCGSAFVFGPVLVRHYSR
jgi:hypothetical protein